MELYQHNLKPYSELSKIAVGDCVVFVTATGTGKSYVAGKLVEERDCKTLILTPRRNISKQWEDLLKDHLATTDVWTYQKLSRISRDKYKRLFSSYDLVILDEVHHIGAVSWGRPISYCLSNASKLKLSVVGLTADPVRYTDGGIDVGEELFNGERVDGLMLEDAISQKVLPEFNYISNLFDYPNEVREAWKNVGTLEGHRGSTIKRLLGRLDFTDNLERVTNIVKENIITSDIPLDKRHIVMFVSSIDDFAGARTFAHKLGIKDVFESSYKYSQKKNDKALADFKKSENAVFICVDMLNEGVHCKEIDTVIMLRRTSSPNIFFQQLGRALDSGSNKDIWVFDFVANAKALDITSLPHFERTEPLSTMIRSCCSQKVVKDYSTECLELIHEIRLLLADKVPWIEEEDNILREFYPTEGSECFSRLPERGESSCYKRAAILGLNKIRWTEDEDNILREYYSTEGQNVALRLNNKTKSQASQRARSLGLSASRVIDWSKKDDNLIKKYYPLEGTSCTKRLSKEYGVRQVAIRAAQLGVQFDRNLWTESQDKILKQYYPSKEECQKRIPNRSWISIVKRAGILGLSVSKTTDWTEEEIQYLIENANLLPAKDIAKKLGRSASSVSCKRRKLGLTGTQNFWKEEDIEDLLKIYPDKGACLQRFPDRSWDMIKQKACSLRKRK